MTECGNGLLDASEGCDDGNRDDYDGCSSTCQIEAGMYMYKDRPDIATKLSD